MKKYKHKKYRKGSVLICDECKDGYTENGFICETCYTDYKIKLTKNEADILNVFTNMWGEGAVEIDSPEAMWWAEVRVKQMKRWFISVLRNYKP
jgi:hypothetical protein